jgi:regulator of telomere elongation helicase 1
MELEIGNVTVTFPYQPYAVQVDFMEKVIQSCTTRQYALLESPTGTGKTLALLCATLSWCEQHPGRRIVYASRTHSQLSNVVNELRKTRFRPSVSHIASRSLLCLNDSVRKQDAATQARSCRDLRRKKQCQFLFDEKITSSSPQLLNQCIDVEDFVAECRRRSLCPYMVSQLASRTADVVLTPYTYFVDPIVRDRLPLETFLSSILILDEAHNCPDQCSEHFSIDLPFFLVANCQSVLAQIEVAALRIPNSPLDFARLGQVRLAFLAWSGFLTSLEATDDRFRELMTVPRSDDQSAQVRDPEFLISMLEKAGFHERSVDHICETIDEVLAQSLLFNLAQSDLYALEVAEHFLRVVFRRAQDREHNIRFLRDFFAVCVTNEPSLGLVCFTPAPGFKEICDMIPHTIILTSGTLSPLDSFARELGQSFPLRLENCHVADADQVFVGVVGRGVGQQPFQFTFANQKDKAMRKELVESLQSVYETVPSGILTFFPSFAFLDEVSPLIVRQQSHLAKKVFVEPRDNTKLSEVLGSFHRAAARGASLLAVCRGKLSEGLDFADDAARCVCVVGVPFPNLTDFRVKLKMQWLDSKGRGMGSRWYTETAMRAVNQAIGRAIRHRNDFAAILLFDDRYAGFQNLLSKWIKPSVRLIRKWTDLVGQLGEFFLRQVRGFKGPPVMLPVDTLTRGPAAPAKPKPPPKVDTKPSILQSIAMARASPDALELRRVPSGGKAKKERKVDAEVMRSRLQDLFARSQIGESRSQPVPMRKAAAVAERSAAQMPSTTPAFPLKCAFCGEAGGNLKKLRCGHGCCRECFELQEAIQMPCPMCK